MKKYFYKAIILLFVILVSIILIQKCYYNRKYNRKLRTPVAEIELIESELQEKPELTSILVTHKPDKIVITTKEDSNITTRKYNIPEESEYKTEIDTLGRVELIYKNFGKCFYPKVGIAFLPIGINGELSVRIFYWRRFGVDVGIGIYPFLGGKIGIDYRLSKYKYISNCSLNFGGFYNGKWMAYAGFSVFLR